MPRVPGFNQYGTTHTVSDAVFYEIIDRQRLSTMIHREHY